jgi:2',3'-cyclic-nucleotide 2'-phosphodiesterase (5'-nucleotidase family)
MHAAVDNFPRFAFMVDSLRGLYPDLLLVSAGDNQTGNPVNDQYPILTP